MKNWRRTISRLRRRWISETRYYFSISLCPSLSMPSFSSLSNLRQMISRQIMGWISETRHSFYFYLSLSLSPYALFIFSFEPLEDGLKTKNGMDIRDEVFFPFLSLFVSLSLCPLSLLFRTAERLSEGLISETRYSFSFYLSLSLCISLPLCPLSLLFRTAER